MPKPRPVPTTNYNITALIDRTSGTIRLSGDIVGDVVEVIAGENAAITITDTTDSVLYAAVTSTSGAPGCWGRASSGGTTNTFNAVSGESHCVVYAVSRTSAKAVTYGPVITIKPKG